MSGRVGERLSFQEKKSLCDDALNKYQWQLHKKVARGGLGMQP